MKYSYPMHVPMRWTLLLIATLSLLVTPTALAQDSVEITLTAPEDCPDTVYCFEVTEGSIADISAGDEVTVTFVNDDNLPHDVHVTEIENADVGGDTDAGEAIANTPDVEGGEEETLTFEAPVDGDSLYIWCDQVGHEEGGMNLEGGQNGAPLPGLPALALVAIAAAFIRRR